MGKKCKRARHPSSAPLTWALDQFVHSIRGNLRHADILFRDKTGKHVSDGGTAKMAPFGKSQF
jgi:hypothetical protein